MPSQERWKLRKEELDILLQSYGGNHGDAIATMEDNVAMYIIQGKWHEAELLGESSEDLYGSLRSVSQGYPRGHGKSCHDIRYVQEMV